VVRVKPRDPPETGVEWWRQLASGFAYAFGFTGTGVFAAAAHE